MSDDLFIVSGKDDFISGDEESLVLCRSCFEADQAEGPHHLAAGTMTLT